MAWEIEATDEFAGWYSGLSVEEQDEVIARVDLLEGAGPGLGAGPGGGGSGAGGGPGGATGGGAGKEAGRAPLVLNPGKLALPSIVLRLTVLKEAPLNIFMPKPAGFDT